MFDIQILQSQLVFIERMAGGMLNNTTDKNEQIGRYDVLANADNMTTRQTDRC